MVPLNKLGCVQGMHRREALGAEAAPRWQQWRQHLQQQQKQQQEVERP